MPESVRRILYEVKNDPHKQIIIAICCLAAILRLIFVLRPDGIVFLGSDDSLYIKSAREFLKTFSIGYGPSASPNATVVPAYTLFLAMTILIAKLSATVTIQALLSTTSVYLTYRIGKRMDARIGLVAAFLYAIYYPSIWLAGTILTDTLFTTLFLLAVELTLISIENSKYWRWVGVVLGIATLVRPEIVVMFVASLVVIALSYKPENIWKNLMIVIAIWFAIMMPWWIRNAVLFRTFIPFSTDGGKVLLESTYYPEEQSAQPNMKATWPKGKNDLETDKLLRAYAIKRIQEHIKEDSFKFFSYTTFEKLKYMCFYPYFYFWRDATMFYFSEFYHFILLIFAAVGMVMTAISKRMVLIFIILLALCNIVFHLVLTIGYGRYFVPIIPLLCILAAYAMSEIKNSLKTA